MRRSTHDAERMDHNRLPTGKINPIDLPKQHRPMLDMRDTYEEDGTIDLIARHAHLVSLARTSLSHATFPALSPGVVAYTIPPGASAWQRAKRKALSSMMHVGSAPRIIAWEGALGRAYKQLLCTSASYIVCHYSDRYVFREAVKVVYGDEFATCMLTIHTGAL